MKLNENNPYIDGRKSNGGRRIGAGRPRINVDCVFINVPILVNKDLYLDVAGIRKEMRDYFNSEKLIEKYLLK